MPEPVSVWVFGRLIEPANALASDGERHVVFFVVGPAPALHVRFVYARRFSDLKKHTKDVLDTAVLQGVTMYKHM